MELNAKIVHSRLLLGDFISDDNEENELISKLKNFRFEEKDIQKNAILKFTSKNISDFINQLINESNESTHDSILLDYIENIFFWVYNSKLMPLKVLVIEVLLDHNKLQILQKEELERNVWNLVLLLGDIFCEGNISKSKNFKILKFSYKNIHDTRLINTTIEFFFEKDISQFNSLYNKIESLEKISKNSNESYDKIECAINEVMKNEPMSYFNNGFSYEQSIIRGYSNETFILGKVSQSILENSPPLYLVNIKCGTYDNEILLNPLPVLELSNGLQMLDFAWGAGKLLALQLLNSWNKYVKEFIIDSTTKQNSDHSNSKSELNKILKELQNLVFLKDKNEKIPVNYSEVLHDLSNPSEKTFLYEFLIPTKRGTSYLENPEQFGLQKPRPLVSSFASIILNYLDVNKKQLQEAIELKKLRIDVSKIKEDHKYSREMLYLTVIVAIATLVNVILFILKIR